MLDYVTNVITGTFAHWNGTNNQVVKVAWEESETFNPDVRDRFRPLLTTSHSVVSALIGPDSTLRRTRSPRDIKRLDESHYARVYHTLPLSFLTLLPWSDESKDSFVRALPGSYAQVWRQFAPLRAAAKQESLSTFCEKVSILIADALQPLDLRAGARRITFDYAVTMLVGQSVQQLSSTLAPYSSAGATSSRPQP